jgi:hypothetical protein
VIELTFEQLRSALACARLSPDRWADLWAVLNQKKQANYGVSAHRGQGARRGMSCGKLHPGIPSEFVPRSEKRKTTGGQERIYTVMRCVRCNKAYKACVGCHHEHRNSECYHQTRGVLDCDCTKFVPYRRQR